MIFLDRSVQPSRFFRMEKWGPLRMPALFLGLILLATPAFAEGWTSITGKNRQGDTVQWDFESDSGDVSKDAHGRTVLASVTVVNRQSKKVVYENQVCTFSEEWDVFSCAQDGTSPLAGAVYTITPDPRECGGYIHTLKKGTGRADAPRKMHRDQYEC